MKPVIISQTFEASAQKVWKAITDLNEMKLWYFDNIDNFRAEPGFKSKFEVQSGKRVFTHLWEVIEVDARKRLAVNWKYAEYSGDSVVVFELKENANRTTLTLTMKVLEDFPDDIPEFKRESCQAGWEFFIQQRLKSYLEINQ